MSLHKNPPLIYIEWCDAIESQAGWQEVEVIEEWAKTSDWLVAECGFLVEETKEHLVFASRKGIIREIKAPSLEAL